MPNVECDVLVVGAGPAGMFAALSLAAAGVDRIVLIDAGPDVDGRRAVRGPANRRRGLRAELEQGIGGAGLFSDGKLCLSLDVGGHLETTLDDRHRASLLAEIEGVFGRLLAAPMPGRVPGEADLAKVAARQVGLDFKYYPVAHIGTDRCYEVIIALRELIAHSGVTILPHTELSELSVDSGGEKVARVRSASGVKRIQAAKVILAMGKVGAQHQADICRRLGVPTVSQPIYVGARLESSAQVIAPLFAHAKDPKYSLCLPDGSKVKTHCASEHGEVLALRYAGRPLAGGHNYSWAKTDRSGFSILWDGFDVGADSYEAAMEIMGRAARKADGRLLAQLLSDCRAGRATSTTGLRAAPLSCRESAPGNLREVLPAGFFAPMEAMLDRLEGLAPALRSSDSVLYGPAVEWWMKRVLVTSSEMTTDVPGLSVCGDGSGWSQGIVHSAATGMLAAHGIRKKRGSILDWVDAHLGESAHPSMLAEVA